MPNLPANSFMLKIHFLDNKHLLCFRVEKDYVKEGLRGQGTLVEFQKGRRNKNKTEDVEREKKPLDSSADRVQQKKMQFKPIQQE